MNRRKSLITCLTVILTLLSILPAHAVLKEQSLERTLGVLRYELEHSYKQQKTFLAKYETMSESQHHRLVSYMQRCEQISLILYSQKEDFTFDVAYACQQATDLYASLHKTNLPYDQARTRILREIARYDSLIIALQQLPPAIGGSQRPEPQTDSLIVSLIENDSTDNDSLNLNFFGKKEEEEDGQQPFLLSEEEQADREKCLIYAKALRNNLARFLDTLTKDNEHYEGVANKVEKLNDYAQKKYSQIQLSIYQNGGTNYFSILTQLPMQWKYMLRDFSEKYRPLGANRNFSEWRGPIVLGVSVFMIFYLAIAIAVSYLLLALLPKLVHRLRRAHNHKHPAAKHVKTKKRTTFKRPISTYRDWRLKRPVVVIVVGIALFALVIQALKSLLSQNIFIMAADLIITLAWLMLAINLSLLIRLRGRQVRGAVAVYTPFIAIACITILFRIVLIPNSFVNIFFPPILLFCILWQLRQQRKKRPADAKLPLSDSVYVSISQVAMIIGLVLSLLGYTLLAVLVMIWWTFQLAGIQTVTCLYDLTALYEEKVLLKKNKLGASAGQTPQKLIAKLRHGDFFVKTWFYDFIRLAVLPVLLVISFLASIKMAADLFEMGTIVTNLFFTDFINQPGVIQLSLFKLSLVVALFFVFRYVNYAVRSYFYHFYRKAKKDEAEMNETLARNVIAILVWGSYFIFALVLLQVPKSGISIVTAGLATGLGFAMKDLLENFFYGISLMSGRLRVGDYIECDGVLGKVETITYQSTQVITTDGSVLAFLNSSLFSKNFKNLTRNHGYILLALPFGVAYGSNVEQVRQLIIDALKPLKETVIGGHHMLDTKRDIIVRFEEFGASSVDLSAVAWVRVEHKLAYLSQAREIIYDTLNNNGIEIPFPQQDVYIRKT